MSRCDSPRSSCLDFLPPPDRILALRSCTGAFRGTTKSPCACHHLFYWLQRANSYNLILPVSIRKALWWGNCNQRLHKPRRCFLPLQNDQLSGERTKSALCVPDGMQIKSLALLSRDSGDEAPGRGTVVEILVTKMINESPLFNVDSVEKR